jgi:C-terminal processing protease CtpA/Prc
MPREFPELPGWSFDADEVSAGVYRAFGRDRAGRNVEATGIDPDVLIEKCKQAALQMMSDTKTSTGLSGGIHR